MGTQQNIIVQIAVPQDVYEVLEEHIKDFQKPPRLGETADGNSQCCRSVSRIKPTSTGGSAKCPSLRGSWAKPGGVSASVSRSSTQVSSRGA